MCFVLFIAAGSFFSIPKRVAKILPAVFATDGMRAIPIVQSFLPCSTGCGASARADLQASTHLGIRLNALR